MERAAHRDTVYRTKTDREVSWFEAAPERRWHVRVRGSVQRRQSQRGSSLTSQACGVWHDRAVFHFLTTREDRVSD